jgi:hypothetical protein
MTVVVHNNMLYGMTGGQPSAVTPCGFRTAVRPEGKAEPGYDLCSIIRAAGAPYVSRLNGAGDFSAELAEAFSSPGFSLVEVIESCPSYGSRHNPGSKPADIARAAGLEFGVWRAPGRPAAMLRREPDRPSLLAVEPIAVRFSSPLACRFTIMVAGSAGGQVQQAAEALARAAIAAGLHAAKKGTYPVTVGTGYSIAGVILAPEPVLFTDVGRPDALVIVSADGLGYAREAAGQMTEGTLVIDDSLEPPPCGASVRRGPFRTLAGPKDAALLALLFLLRCRPVLPPEALLESAPPGRAANLPALLAQLEPPPAANNQPNGVR